MEQLGWGEGGGNMDLARASLLSSFDKPLFLLHPHLCTGVLESSFSLHLPRKDPWQTKFDTLCQDICNIKANKYVLIQQAKDNTDTLLDLHQTFTNPHPWANMQGVIRVVSTTRTVHRNPLHRTLSTSQHIVIQLYLVHLKFLSEGVSCLPCPHLILHPQEVLDH